MKIPADLLDQLLRVEHHRIPFHAGSILQKLFPKKHVLAISTCSLEFDDYLGAQRAVARPAAGIQYQHFSASWVPETDERVKLGRAPSGFMRRAENVVLEVEWNGHFLLLIRLSWCHLIREEGRAFIVADSEQVARDFYSDVSRWSANVHGEVLVFSDAAWKKDSALCDSIRDFTFENLILEPSLGKALREDVEQFFKHRQLYQEHRIPWKRGILLIGPPGNGKSHTIKALVNRLKLPCLYVRSVDAVSSAFFGENTHSQIASVFQMARQSAPCLLVLEDLDTLCKPENRSVLLNELDGFAGNIGVCIIATTNFPEKLDSAITDRPSRFDRKYTFLPPALPERKAYLEYWNRQWSPRLRLSPAGIETLAQQTESFSYAYLKELCLSCTMAWFNAGPAAQMDDVAIQQAQVIAAQLKQTPPPASDPALPHAPLP